MKNSIKFTLLSAMLLVVTGCVSVPNLGTPAQLSMVAPTPIEDNTGAFMSPYTSDGVLAEWVDNAVNAKMGSAIGGAVGAYAGQKLAENIPFVGGWIGQSVGETLGRKVALEAAGGEEFIRESSDLSFNSVQDLAVYIYVNYSHTEHYQDALEATWEIYPELKHGYMQALYSATAQAGY
ncbi:hypothetical protein DXV75_03475 [Alteromonas aestuariivivens]|uniref:Glycine zipper 2TM domain-containing protein n=1 Tax=Alteromonas aestuariivivens TaxID=1938339 RepID=A0A3D8MBZ9_9ALTE|nr:hypothetical protein [Alteromonas aestuariivivens]RDV28038.1 hypothetical protein DXV75_03475 [Alteromonas aestuariivivens]